MMSHITVNLLNKPWAARYAKFLALVLLYGAIVHIGNISGLSGTPWRSTPLLWQGMEWRCSSLMAWVRSLSGGGYLGVYG
ncbi:MAG: hypothetical protein AAGD25_19725 [Cyanobacteria bacterium P01_F01_bin.150]